MTELDRVAEEETKTTETEDEAQVETPEAEGAATPEEAPEPTLEEVIAQLQDDLAGAQDAALRAQADAQNVQRRAEADVEKARKFALERFVGELLPVVDNLERALEAAAGGDDAVQSIAEGVELTLKSLNDVMGKFNVAVVDP